MIKINNLQKYFNKKKSNEIHVINDTTLEFSETGLVCLLGNSGSGKTTLLNVIGGLDKVDSGTINFKEFNIKKYNSSQWDYIRNRYFGYVFQNYVLLPELTVFQNLEFVLKMLNVEEKEISERIEYALKAVGMEKFKKRKPTQLSGGQQQRIAIARALVKSPNVIIADEPTGNLDEKNSTQIMNIIKKISQECLVILVTHERRLADFYGDRIIEIADGVVIEDRTVSSVNEFHELDTTNIYLQEYNKEEYKNDNVNIKYFYQDIKKDIDLNIVFKDNTFFIQSSIDNIKIKFIDNASEVKVIDSKKPVFQKQNIEDFDYQLKPIVHTEKKSKSVIKFTDTIKMAFSHLNGLKKRQKLLFVTMFFSTIMITIGFINLFSSKAINEDDFLYYNTNLIQTTGNQFDIVNSLKADEMFVIDPSKTSVISFFDLDFNQNDSVYTRSENYNLTNSVIPIDVLQAPNVVKGRLPIGSKEAIIDKKLVDKYLGYTRFKNVGIKYADQFLGMTFTYGTNFQFEENTNNRIEIVGIVDSNNPNIYVNSLAYKMNAFNFSYYNLTGTESVYTGFENETLGYTIDINGDNNGNLDLKGFVLPARHVIVSESFYNDYDKYFAENKLSFAGLEFTVAAVILSNSSLLFGNPYIINFHESDVEQLYKLAIESDKMQNYLQQYFIYTNNKQELITTLSLKGFKAEDKYTVELADFKLRSQNIQLYISSLIVLAASLVFLFLLMRSSMMQRIYQIGVYRALGVKKVNVHKIFLTEIFFITLITTLLGIGVVRFSINSINSLFPMISYPWYISPISFVFVLGVNLIVGSLPVAGLMRLTPSQILSKYDI